MTGERNKIDEIRMWVVVCLACMVFIAIAAVAMSAKHDRHHSHVTTTP